MARKRRRQRIRVSKAYLYNFLAQKLNLLITQHDLISIRLAAVFGRRRFQVPISSRPTMKPACLLHDKVNLVLLPILGSLTAAGMLYRP